MVKLKWIFIILLFAQSIRVNAQDKVLRTKITLQISNALVTDVLNEITEKYAIFFSYDPEIFISKERKNYSFINQSLENVLEEILASHIGFKVINNQVILYQKPDDEIKKQTVRGHIVDKDTKMPLIGVAVVIMNINPVKSTITNRDGYYMIQNVPVGRQTLMISYLGYKTVTLDNVLLLSAKEKILDIELEESVEEIEEVIVSAYARKENALNSMAIVGARSFSTEETEKYAGSWGDPSRMAMNFAGIVMASDERNDIIIRGNSPTALIWQLEGVPIPSPNHFDNLGANGGPVSILNNNTLSRSDFFTGAFPAEYGNGYSGVFDLRMRNGNDDKYEFTIQSGFAGYELGVEGPIFRRNKSSFVVNYRYSMLGLVDNLLWIGELPHYQDISYKVNIPYKKGNISLFGFGGASYIVFTNDITGEDLQWNWTVDEKDASNTWFSGIKNTHFITNNTHIVNAFTYSIRSPMGDMKYSRNGEQVGKIIEEDDDEFKYTYSFKLISKLNRKNMVKSGIRLDKTDVSSVNYDNYIRNDSIIHEKLFEYHHYNIFTLNAFIDFQHKFTDRISLNTGIHYQHFFLNNTKSFEPRMGLKFQYSEKGKVGLVYGNHCMVQPLYYYLQSNGAENNLNENLDFTRSHQYVLGHDYSFSKNLRMKVELYYQDLYDIPVHMSDGTFSLINYGYSDEMVWSDSLVNKGTGDNFGIDITFEKFLSDGYYFLITGSLFNSTYRGSDGVKRNTRYNGNYVFNALGGYEFKIGKNSLMDFNIRCVYAGGMRYIPIDLDRSRELGYPYYLYDQGYDDQLNNYFRLDFRTGFVFQQRRLTHEIAFEITNITNHKNEFTRIYDESADNIVSEYQQGFFPMGMYRLSF